MTKKLKVWVLSSRRHVSIFGNLNLAPTQPKQGHIRMYHLDVGAVGFLSRDYLLDCEPLRLENAGIEIPDQNDAQASNFGPLHLRDSLRWR
jgi:hypothetical protein